MEDTPDSRTVAGQLLSGHLRVIIARQFGPLLPYTRRDMLSLGGMNVSVSYPHPTKTFWSQIYSRQTWKSFYESEDASGPEHLQYSASDSTL